MLTQINESELDFILKNTPSEQNIMLVGKHGIGKSEIIRKTFESIGKKVVSMFCSQAADPGDIIGLPRENEETGSTEFMLPWWFPTDGTPVVLFLDELNRARPEILQVVMDLALNRKIAGKALPEGSQIVSAVNDGDEYQLTDLDPALVSRFNVYSFSPTLSGWVKWATDNGLDSTVISFVSSHSKYLDSPAKKDFGSLDKTPDRRAWEKVSSMMPFFSPTLVFKKMVCGVVGGDAGCAFFQYASMNSFVKPDELFDGSDRFRIASKLGQYDIKQLISFNDEVFSYANKLLSDDTSNGPKVEDGLMWYMDFLTNSKNKNREAMAHFITNYESASYADVNYLVAMSPDKLEHKINEFILCSGETL